MKTLVLTAFDNAMAPIGELTAPLMMAYANRHGYDFHCTRHFEVGCQSYWQKVWDIHAFTSLSNPVRHHYDRILWLDSDQMICNPDWTPPWTEGFHASLDWGTDAVSDDHFSACGFVVCRDAFGIFSSVAQLHYLFREREFPEQMALRSMRESHGDMMHTHPRRVFNAVPKEISEEAPEPWELGDFCCHLTHVPCERRVEVFHLIQEQLKTELP